MARSGLGDGMTGTPAEIEALYMQHKDRLLTLATALTGHISAGEDIVHDVFAMLVKDGLRRGHNNHFAGYLSVCVRNRAMDWHRTQERANKLTLAYAACRHENPEKSPARRAEDGEQSLRLLEFVYGLPDEQREIVGLKFWGGLSFQDIAELRATTKSAVYAHYCDALNTLEAAVKGGYQNV
jgi:RNA polymerase sigma-70 factor (ECF subfamily)